MKRYSVAQARAHFSELLDTAEAGGSVVIERRGARFRLKPERARKRCQARASIIAHVDPIVLEGRWTWELGNEGLRFVGRRRRT